jgi:hypothetical protein
MTETKKAELSKLQGWAIEAAARMDTHEHRRYTDLILYWIRREIYGEIKYTLLKFDPVKASIFTVSAVQLTDEVRNAFGKQQAAIITVAGEGDHEKLAGQFVWFCTWIDHLVQHNVNLHIQPYIKVSVKKINGHGRKGTIGGA